MNFTKKAIISTFEELLTERPLSKITVKDIVERCGINRNTFYYYFEGIPSLIESITRNIADEIISAHSKFGSPIDCVAPVVRYCQAHRTEILHIYRSVPRESFQAQVDRTALYIVREYVDTTTADLFSGESPERDILIRYYKCTLVGVILDWLDAGMRYDLLAGAASICELFAGAGKQAFLKCVDSEPVFTTSNGRPGGAFPAIPR